METLITDLKNLLNNHLSLLEDIFLNNQVYLKPKTIWFAVRTKNWKELLYFLQRYEGQTSTLIEVYSAACQLGDKELMDSLYPLKVKDPEHLRRIMSKRGNCDIPRFRGGVSKDLAIENDDLELYIKAYSSKHHHCPYGYYDVSDILEKGACSILEHILEHCNGNITDDSPSPTIKDPRIARIIVRDLQLGRRKFIFGLNELISMAKDHNHDVVAKILSDYAEQRK